MAIVNKTTSCGELPKSGVQLTLPVAAPVGLVCDIQLQETVQAFPIDPVNKTSPDPTNVNQSEVPERTADEEVVNLPEMEDTVDTQLNLNNIYSIYCFISNLGLSSVNLINDNMKLICFIGFECGTLLLRQDNGAEMRYEDISEKSISGDPVNAKHNQFYGREFNGNNSMQVIKNSNLIIENIREAGVGQKEEEKLNEFAIR